MTRSFLRRACFVALALILAFAPAAGLAQAQPMRNLGRNAPYWVVRSRLDDFRTPSEFVAGFATRDEADQYADYRNQMEPGGLNAWTYTAIERPESKSEPPNEFPPIDTTKPKIPVPSSPRRPGREQEWARLQAEGRALVETGQQLVQLRRTLDDAFRRLKDDIQDASRRKTTFRCRYGLTADQCFSRPPVCPETLAFMLWFKSEIARLRRRSRELSDARDRLNAIARTYDNQVQAFNRRVERWRSEGGSP